MQVDFRIPNIAGTEHDQLQQIRSYLLQFIPQLQWALNSMGNSMETSVASSNTTTTEQKTVVKTNALGGSASSFNEVMALIIKTADTVEAYYDEINSRLSSEYVAQSEFGTYTERTEALETKTAENTTTIYEKLAIIEGDTEDYRKTKGYIQTGIIVDSLSAKDAGKYGKQEGDALIGVELGETGEDGVFRVYARFVSNRLSFYDTNGYEIAYISNFKLYIRNVEITVSLKIGGIVQTIMPNGDVVEKWEGVDG